LAASACLAGAVLVHPLGALLVGALLAVTLYFRIVRRVTLRRPFVPAVPPQSRCSARGCACPTAFENPAPGLAPERS
jgi:hypothetical protein